jgi:hypothetical protein
VAVVVEEVVVVMVVSGWWTLAVEALRGRHR